ncbi:MAG: hypothetical protein AVDCRST_MAG34-627, partial [uncultured Nocardioidaceae bacterium]
DRPGRGGSFTGARGGRHRRGAGRRTPPAQAPGPAAQGLGLLLPRGPGRRAAGGRGRHGPAAGGGLRGRLPVGTPRAAATRHGDLVRPARASRRRAAPAAAEGLPPGPRVQGADAQDPVAASAGRGPGRRRPRRARGRPPGRVRRAARHLDGRGRHPPPGPGAGRPHL